MQVCVRVWSDVSSTETVYDVRGIDRVPCHLPDLSST